MTTEPKTLFSATAVRDDVEVVRNTSQTLAPSGNRFLILLSLLALYILWGTTYLGMRIGLTGFPPFLLASMRFLIAGAILYPILRLRGTPAPTRKQWLGSLLVGILLLVGGN